MSYDDPRDRDPSYYRYNAEQVLLEAIKTVETSGKANAGTGCTLNA